MNENWNEWKREIKKKPEKRAANNKEGITEKKEKNDKGKKSKSKRKRKMQIKMKEAILAKSKYAEIQVCFL